ncbi:hypothetical protein [Pseudoprimorskyibacter insulae]|uniref:Uncharacterized protein n=1 Tax=Pseudoprimorskyibacter insulae TaxID=1695997 RepID=A0A2R8AZR0_9RHOB|nr:hypothetical protein [Pseudoprimorskyibacter insulae]SPF81344.1 hypothetical protein PRI8871_03167 [Pseudoprimorskyibacter insulae]
MKDLLLEACAIRNTSLRQVCLKTGLNYKTINGKINKGVEFTARELFTISQALRFPMEHFLSDSLACSAVQDSSPDLIMETAEQIVESALFRAREKARQNGQHLDTDTLLNWLQVNGGRLDNFEPIKDHVDLYRPIRPEDRTLQPERLGRFSLASVTFDIHSVDDFVDKVGRFDHKIISSTMKAHVEARSVPYRVEDITIDVSIAGRNIHKRYRRVLAPVIDENGKELTLLFARTLA